MKKFAQKNPLIEENELIKLLIAACMETFKPAAITMLTIATKYGVEGLECLALLSSVDYIPDSYFVANFLYENAGIDPLTILPIVES